jgi:hypothetical protein
MDINTLSAASPLAPQGAPSPDPTQQAAQNPSKISSLKPFKVEHVADSDPFPPDKSDMKDVRPLSQPEHNRVMKAFDTAIGWAQKVISALENPSDWSEKTKKLVSDLFPGGLQQPSERDALKTQLTHTLDGMQKLRDENASTLRAGSSEHHKGSTPSFISPETPDKIHFDRMYVSEKWLKDGSDNDLAAIVLHESSHIYANTDDNWKTRPNHSSPSDGKPSFLFDTKLSVPDPESGKSQGDFTFTNAVNNASTVEVATEVLAGVPFDSIK